MKLYFLRHGEAEHNAARLLGGLHDTKLTKKGVQQAKEGVELIKPLNIDIIYASPLLRARETGKILAEETETKLIIDERVVERGVGELEGTHSKLLVSTTPDDTPGAETIQQLRTRAKEFLKEIEAKHQNQTVLLVSHGAFIKMCLSLRTDKKWEDIRTIQLPHVEPFENL